MSVDQGDWIKLSRAMLDSPIFQHDGLFRLWAYCLMRANWKPRKWLIPGTLREVEMSRGQFITGRQSLHCSLYPKLDRDGNVIHYEYVPAPITLWRWLKSLEKMKCITIESVISRCSIITVCNYCTYQDAAESSDQPEIRSRSGGDQVVITDEERKKERKERRNTKATFVEPTVEEVGQYCCERKNRVSPDSFVDFYASKGWLVGNVKMKDWKAAVRTWEKRNQMAGSSESMQTNGNHKPTIPEPGSPELMNWRP